MKSEFSSSNFVHWGQKETQFSQKMTLFRRPLDDRAALFIAKTALHMKVLSFLSTVQQLVLTAGHLWPRFWRRFYHALKTANYTKSDSGPSILLSSIVCTTMVFLHTILSMLIAQALLYRCHSFIILCKTPPLHNPMKNSTNLRQTASLTADFFVISLHAFYVILTFASTAWCHYLHFLP